MKHLGTNSSEQSYKDKFLILDPIDRTIEQNKIEGIDIAPYGLDIWNAYEFSYLNSKLNPCLQILEIKIPSDSPITIESKSMKLYLNSFYDQVFDSDQKVIEIIQNDLSKICKSSLSVNFIKTFPKPPIAKSLLSENSMTIEANSIYQFQGFRSICPVTNQPDWAVIYIKLDQNINRDWVLEYLMSFRNIGEFHELCIDKIYSTLKTKFSLNELSIYGRFMRRGGIDINPLRSSNSNFIFENHREFSQ